MFAVVTAKSLGVSLFQLQFQIKRDANVIDYNQKYYHGVTDYFN